MKTRERKIVVAVDESDESMYALSWCLTNFFTSTSNNTLVLLYVKPPPSVYYALDTPGFMSSNDVVSAMEKYSKNLVDSVMERAQAVYGKLQVDLKDVHIEKIVETGDAKDIICYTVDKLGADTLVIGSHGYGFLKRTLLGSVSDHCAKHVKCPIVIVKSPEGI